LIRQHQLKHLILDLDSDEHVSIVSVLQIPNLETLSLNFAELRHSDAIPCAMSSFRKLASLALHNCRVSKDTFSAVLRAPPLLTSIELVQMRVSDDEEENGDALGLTCVPSILHFCLCLERLSIEFDDPPDEFAANGNSDEDEPPLTLDYHLGLHPISSVSLCLSMLSLRCKFQLSDLHPLLFFLKVTPLKLVVIGSSFSWAWFASKILLLCHCYQLRTFVKFGLESNVRDLLLTPHPSSTMNSPSWLYVDHNGEFFSPLIHRMSTVVKPFSLHSSRCCLRMNDVNSRNGIKAITTNNKQTKHDKNVCI